MNVWVNVHTCWTYGANPSISLLGEFLRMDCPDFGAAISELDIHVYFDTRKTEHEFATPFDSYIKKLPLHRLHRKKGSFSLSFLSSLGDSRLVEENRAGDFDLFVGSAREILSALRAIKRKLNPDDDFDYDAFIAFLEARSNALPATQEEFIALEQTLHERTPNQSPDPTRFARGSS